MNKLVRFVALSLLGASALVSTFAIAHNAVRTPSPAQVAGGNPPPCNPKIELCPPMGL